MHPVEIENTLKRMTVLVDTREQPTPLARSRWAAFGYPFRRQKLNFGDYSAEFELPDGRAFPIDSIVCVERKMSFDELANCFCHDRERFEREFERAREAGAKTYLLVESGSWEMAYAGQYKSRMTPHSLVASMTTWLARYQCQIIFCQPRTTGKLIAEILQKEGRELMLNGKLDKTLSKEPGQSGDNSGKV